MALWWRRIRGQYGRWHLGWRRIRGRYGRWRLGGAAYAGSTVDGGLGSIEKYWEVLGGFGRIHCRLYCKQYGVMLRRGFKAAKKTPKISQSLSKSPKISHAATHNSAPRRRQNPHAATHNSAPRKRQNPHAAHPTPRRESGRTAQKKHFSPALRQKKSAL